jgi:hypothetical protein
MARRIRETSPVEAADLADVLRIVAECTLYNLATLTPFCKKPDLASDDWGSSIHHLFPADDTTLSPFLGGCHALYQIMLSINMLLSANGHGTHGLTSLARTEALISLTGRLDMVERRIPYMYPASEEAKLYVAKHRLTAIALRIHLHKIVHPQASSTEPLIRLHVTEAVQILIGQDIREPGNPALRWPLTILACATGTDEEFDVVKSKMQEIERILDISNSQKIASAYTVLGRFQGNRAMKEGRLTQDWYHTCKFDLLLEPWKLNRSLHEE